MELGMIGLGRMGANMVRRLLDGGHHCVVFDRSPTEVSELKRAGAVGTASLGDLVERLAKPRAVWLVVRGQYGGYRNEPGVSADSQTKAFAAVRFEINSWRWKGVPFLLRASTCLPITCTEVLVRFHQPPAIYGGPPPARNYFRIRISPDVVIALGAHVLDSGKAMTGRPIELTVTDEARAAGIDAYERLLHDAMNGDASLFAREDSVEHAWRIIDPILNASTPLSEYAPNTWGPTEVERLGTPCCGWHSPIMGQSASRAQ